MNLSTDQYGEMLRVILDLQHELSDAYDGIKTLPREHPAVMAYERSIHLLLALPSAPPIE